MLSARVLTTSERTRTRSSFIFQQLPDFIVVRNDFQAGLHVIRVIQSEEQDVLEIRAARAVLLGFV